MTGGKHIRPVLLVASLGTVLIVLCLLSIAVGAAGIPLDEVVRALFGHAPSRLVDNIVWTARVPGPRWDSPPVPHWAWRAG